MYLREQIMTAQSASCIVVDGYYYKILAKCLLLGLVDEEVFAAWRRFPQPMLVIYLDADLETTWQRARSGLLNPFEYYGALPSREGFQHFQRDLAAALLREVENVPVRVVRGDASPRSALDEIEILIRNGMSNER
jgi:thymidylate kinase